MLSFYVVLLRIPCILFVTEQKTDGPIFELTLFVKSPCMDPQGSEAG